MVVIVWLIPVGMLGLGMLDPDPRGWGTHEQLGLPACLTREWVGIPCPGCGVTTAAVEFTHGHPVRSLVIQPLGFLAALGLLLFFPWVLWAHVTGRDAWVILMARVPDHWARWVAVVVLVAWFWKITQERLPQ